MASFTNEHSSNSSFGFHDKWNIFRYLQVINIAQARDLEIDIHIIECRVRTEALAKLSKNVDLWISKGGVLLDEKTNVNSYTYGGSSSNGRTLTGRKYCTTMFFSNFKICKETDDGYVEKFSFEKLSASEQDKYKDYADYDVLGSPSMLQVFYGLMKKYDDVIVKANGIVPELYE